MGKFLKSGKVVIVLSGRYAGKKAIIVKSYEDGHDKRKFSHVLVAGIKRNPRKVTKSMSKKKVNKRSKIIPFVKHINYQHVMPTRYSVDLSDGLKKVLDGRYAV
jgi:large subunit ribosomal protein L27e